MLSLPDAGRGVVDVRCAFHLRGGERCTVELIDAWLARYGYDVAGCADPYDACVHLLLNQAQAPELAFLGTDWLAREEFALLEYVREAWPRTGILVYGSDLQSAFGALDMMAFCKSRAALRESLAQTPDDLLANLRRGTPIAGARARLPRPREAVAEAPTSQALPPSMKDAAKPPAHAAPGESGAASLSQSLLTRDELAALLGDQ